MLETLSCDDFAARLHTKFYLKEADVALELTEANPAPCAPGQESFSLIFTGPKDFILPQQTYTVTHENLGAGNLFLVPVKQTETGIKYEAFFNRLIKTPN